MQATSLIKKTGREIARALLFVASFLAIDTGVVVASGGSGSVAVLTGLVTGDRLTLASTSGTAVTATGQGTGGGGSFTSGSSNGASPAVQGVAAHANTTGGHFTGGTGSNGVWGQVTGAGAGVVGFNNGSGFGVNASSSSGTGVALNVSGDASSPVRAALHVDPQDAVPSGANAVGDMYVTTAGVLRICTAAGTGGAATWINVGAQP